MLSDSHMCMAYHTLPILEYHWESKLWNQISGGMVIGDRVLISLVAYSSNDTICLFVVKRLVSYLHQLVVFQEGNGHDSVSLKQKS